MPVNCPHCGAENGDRNLRCSLCGKPLPQGTLPQAAAPPAGQPQPQPQPRGGAGSTHGYIYDDQGRVSPRNAAYQPPPPGMRSVSERRTYREAAPETAGLKLGLSFEFNKRALTSAIILLLAAAFLIAATYLPWLTIPGPEGGEISGWDLYELGKSGEGEGSAFHIPDIFEFKQGSDYDTSSGILLTGLWTLGGGLILLVVSLFLPILRRNSLYIIAALVGLLMLIVTGINLVSAILGTYEVDWPMYVLPAAGVLAMIFGYDARRAFV